MNPVIIDSSIWIEFFNKDTEIARKAARFVEDGRAAIAGPILYEVLQGTRSKDEQEVVLSALLGVTMVEINTQIWIKAAEISSALRKRGITIPMSDIVIAAAAIEHGYSVFTSDAHFKKVPGVKLV